MLMFLFLKKLCVRLYYANLNPLSSADSSLTCSLSVDDTHIRFHQQQCFHCWSWTILSRIRVQVFPQRENSTRLEAPSATVNEVTIISSCKNLFLYSFNLNDFTCCNSRKQICVFQARHASVTRYHYSSYWLWSFLDSLFRSRLASVQRAHATDSN